MASVYILLLFVCTVLLSCSIYPKLDKKLKSKIRFFPTETLNLSYSCDIHIVIMSKICIVLLLGLVLTTTTAQPTNNVAKAEGMISILSLYSRFFFVIFIIII